MDQTLAEQKKKMSTEETQEIGTCDIAYGAIKFAMLMLQAKNPTFTGIGFQPERNSAPLIMMHIREQEAFEKIGLHQTIPIILFL